VKPTKDRVHSLLNKNAHITSLNCIASLAAFFVLQQYPNSLICNAFLFCPIQPQLYRIAQYYLPIGHPFTVYTILLYSLFMCNIMFYRCVNISCERDRQYTEATERSATTAGDDGARMPPPTLRIM
jgi:hypothetical protein